MQLIAIPSTFTANNDISPADPSLRPYSLSLPNHETIAAPPSPHRAVILLTFFPKTNVQNDFY